MTAASAAPSSPPSKFDLVFVDETGSEHRLPLSDCWEVAFERAGAVRRFASHPGKRSFDGLWWFATTGDHVPFESWMERDHVMALAADINVVGLASQPFWLRWRDEDGTVAVLNEWL